MTSPKNFHKKCAFEVENSKITNNRVHVLSTDVYSSAAIEMMTKIIFSKNKQHW